MKLTWVKCSCGQCDLQYPKELGQFYQGTGFRKEERELMDRAFKSLPDEVEQKTT